MKKGWARARRALALAGLALIARVSADGTPAQAASLRDEVDIRARAVEPKMIAWRRDIHQHPELGNTEHRTAALVADHLRALGLSVRTGVAETGVVGVLKGALPGPVVALRADMDALPIKETTGLPFASTATGSYLGATVPVMHACGHDGHTAILMATAEVLAGMRDRLHGTVVFIFQPSEEEPSTFAPDGKRTWGARQMVEQGVLADPKVDAIFGLHLQSMLRSGEIAWRSGPLMASSDTLYIDVKGRQTHGAQPWAGVDPIVVASQIVIGLQTIASRQMDVTREPSIITIGQFNAGERYNIIPGSAALAGTIRTYDPQMQRDIHSRVTRTATMIAESAGASADVRIVELHPPVVNDQALTAEMAPTLQRVAGEGRWDGAIAKVTPGEDFSYYQDKIPGLFFFLGVSPPEKVAGAAPLHSGGFYVDESALIQGVRALSNLTVDYMDHHPSPP